MHKRVLILEDDPNSAHMLEAMLKEIDSSIQIIWTSKKDDAWKYVMNATISLFLVDIILMPNVPGDISGIQFIEQLRTLYKYQFTPVIFITSLEDPRMYAYSELHSYGYLEKPFDVGKAKKLIEAALQYIPRKEEAKVLFFRKDGILLSVKTSDVVYMESENHNMNIYTAANDILKIPYKTCRQILEEIDNSDFFQCSRNTIVNKHYIRSIDITNRYIALQNPFGNIDIGVTYRKKIKEKFKL